MARYYKLPQDLNEYVRTTRTVLVDAVSTGMTIPVTVRSLSTSWVTVAEAPLFSVIDNAERFWPPDDLTALLSTDRTLRHGELFFQTPLVAHNRGSAEVRVEVRIRYPVGPDGSNNWVQLFNVVIPSYGGGNGDTFLFPVQGMHLVRVPGWSFGQRLQMRASAASVVDVSFTCTEQEMPRHFIQREIVEDPEIPASGPGDAG